MPNINNILPRRLGQDAPATNTVSTLYTCVDLSSVYPNLTMAGIVRVISLYAVNRDPQSETDSVSIWIVPNGDSPSEENVLVNNYPLVKAEELLKSKIILQEWDTIQIRSSKWISTFHAYGEIEYYATEQFNIRWRVVELQQAVANWSANDSEKEELVLLLGWAIQNNSNVCNAP